MIKSDVVAASGAGNESKSLVIPIQRVDTASDDSPTSSPAVAAAGGDDVKTRRSLFKVASYVATV